MTPTREQLQKMKRHACAGCGMTDDEWAEVRGWNDAIDAVLAALDPQEPAPMPPIEVGDIVTTLDGNNPEDRRP